MHILMLTGLQPAKGMLLRVRKANFLDFYIKIDILVSSCFDNIKYNTDRVPSNKV